MDLNLQNIHLKISHQDLKKIILQKLIFIFHQHLIYAFNLYSNQIYVKYLLIIEIFI